MKNKITIHWKKQMHFISENERGNIPLDAAESVGGQGKGVSPKALMLSALGGCTAMDIASLLKKMRAEVDDFKIDVEASLTEEHPKYYDKVTVTYLFYGKDFKKDKIEKAVRLSIERYCGVMEMFRKFSKVNTGIKYISLPA